jgi:hypothetical protein
MFIMHVNWIKLVMTRIVRAENKNDPRYPNSLPFFEAQNVYAVRETTTVPMPGAQFS